MAVFNQQGSQPLNNQLTFLVADALTLKTLYFQNFANWELDAILVTNADAIAHHVKLFFTQGGVDYLIGSATLPPLTGLAGTPGIDLLSAVLAPGQGPLLMTGSDVVKVALAEAALVDATVDVWALGRLV